MATWDVRVNQNGGDGESSVELSVDGDACATFKSAADVYDFVQQLPTIGSRLNAAAKDAFPTVVEALVESPAEHNPPGA